MARERVMMIIIDKEMTGTVRDEKSDSRSSTSVSVNSFVTAFSCNTFFSL